MKLLARIYRMRLMAFSIVLGVMIAVVAGIIGVNMIGLTAVVLLNIVALSAAIIVGLHVHRKAKRNAATA